MLGMMPQKGGGSTNVPGNPMNSGQLPALQGIAGNGGGGMPTGNSKGGATSNVPVPGMGQGGAPGGLASLFMNNRPAMPGAGTPAQLPQITAPRPPVIQDPVRRMPEAPAAASQMPSVYQGPIRTRADLMNYQVRYGQPGANTQGLPTPEEMRLRYITGIGNYSNSGGSGRR
jgi:hypothetical protein